MSSVPWSTRHNPYWRDVGTVDAFWAATLDLASNTPELNIYAREWPLWTYQEQLPPAKFVPDEEGHHCETANVMVSGGCIVSGSDLREAVLFSGVRIHSCCRISQAVVLQDCDIGRDCRLSKVVIDRGCRLPEGGDGDRRGRRARREALFRSDQGVVLVTIAMLEKLDG